MQVLTESRRNISKPPTPSPLSPPAPAFAMPIRQRQIQAIINDDDSPGETESSPSSYGGQDTAPRSFTPSSQGVYTTSKPVNATAGGANDVKAAMSAAQLPRSQPAEDPKPFLHMFPRSSPGKLTTEWAKNVPPYSSSPGNLIDFNDRPPTVPSSYNDESALAAWNNQGAPAVAETDMQHLCSASPPPLTHSRSRSPRHIKAEISQAARSGSLSSDVMDKQSSPPPASSRRDMLSEQMSQQSIQSPPKQRAPTMAHENRRSSTYSQQTQQYRSPPFQPQPMSANVYGGPGLDINLGAGARQSGLKPGARGYHCGFDTMSIVRGGNARNETVVVSGYEGGVNLYQVSKSGQHQVAAIGGLRGGVYAAKILPWTLKNGSARGSSLIALIVHGPVLDDDEVEVGEEAGDRLRSGGSETTRRSQQGRTKITHYQTTVEVYCLKTQGHISTLLAVPKVEFTVAPFIRPRNPPQPSGALSVTADAGNIVVTSGITGELWVWRQVRGWKDSDIGFRCLGKYWTTVQSSLSPESSVHDYASQLDASRNPAGQDPKKRSRNPTGLVSLVGRYLAFCSNPNIKQISLRAQVDVSRSPKSRVPGLSTYAPPQVPNANCAVDTPPGDELWARLSRQAAQEAIRGAQFIADRGQKAWKSYWNPPSSANPAGWTGSTGETPAHMFPPTHGAVVTKEVATAEAVHISIVDLHKLANLKSGVNASSATIATFKLPHGCSYLSLSPNGLYLFTANSRGDVQIIWDLKKIKYTKPSSLATSMYGYPAGPYVRQIASFSRLTVARIVDVVWTPSDDTIAMVTERNTVHFLDLPKGIFQWPPPRRPRPSAAVARNGQPATSKGVSVSGAVATPQAAAAVVGGAVSSLKEWTQPLWSRPRGASSGHGSPLLTAETTATPALVPTRSGALAASLASYAGYGGKAIASGISKSYGAATSSIQHFRRAGDNKLHLPASESVCMVNCVTWLGVRRNRKRKFAVVLDGFIKVYTIRYVPAKAGNRRKGKKREPPRIVVKKGVSDVMLPSLADNCLAPIVRRFLEMDVDDLEFSPRPSSSHDDNSRTAVLPSRPNTATRKSTRRSGAANTIPMAEIGSCAPYPPFHLRAGVRMFVYSPPLAVAKEVGQSLSDSALLDEENLNFAFDDHADPATPAVFSTPTQAAAGHGAPGYEGNWLFGGPIPATMLDVGIEDEEECSEDDGALERVTSRIIEAGGEEPLVSTTRRRRKGNKDDEGWEVGFFEDDCDVIELTGAAE